MKRMLTALIGAMLVVGLVPALALSQPGNGDGNGNNGDNPAQVCRAQLDALGAQGFADAYATNANGRNAFGQCVSEQARGGTTDGDGSDGALNPAQACRQELNQNGTDAFVTQYGTNGNGNNAFGQCVSQHAQATDTDGTPG
jgi:hypothetical protein